MGGTFLVVLALPVLIVIGILFARYTGKTALEEGHSYGLWAVLGFLFGVWAIIALHTAIRADDECHSFTLWAVLGFLFGIGALIMLETGLIAERRAYDFTSYCIIGAGLGAIGLLIACFLPKAVMSEKVEVKAVNKPQTQTPAQPQPKTEKSPFLRSVSTSNNTTASGTVWYCEYCGTTNYVGVDSCRHCYKERKK